MTSTMIALLGFAAWTILLVFAVLLYRTGIVMAGKRPANSWPRGGPLPAGEPALMVRMRDAHQNCLEGLPIFAAIVLVATAAGKLAVTEPLAMFVLYARIAQSVTHLIGTTHWLVFIRASFFSVQLFLYAWMIGQLFG